jgi:hypothetical protein
MKKFKVPLLSVLSLLTIIKKINSHCCVKGVGGPKNIINNLSSMLRSNEGKFFLKKMPSSTLTPLGDKWNRAWLIQRIFVGKKKGTKVPRFHGKKNSEIVIFLDNTRFQAGCQKYNKDSWNFLLSSLTCCQIWIIPLLDYCKKKKSPGPTHPLEYLNSENPQKLWLHTTLPRKTEWVMQIEGTKSEWIRAKNLKKKFTYLTLVYARPITYPSVESRGWWDSRGIVWV